MIIFLKSGSIVFFMDEIKNDVVNVTYETLFDILRMEKRREDIQQLSKTFYHDVVNYLKQKKEIIVNAEHESGIDNYDEIKKLNIQYENVQKIIKEIYERREKKILLLALNTSRTKMNGIPAGALLQQELEFYEQVTRLLDAYRKDVPEKLMHGMLPKEQIAAVLCGVAEKKYENVKQEQPQMTQQSSVISESSDSISTTVSPVESPPEVIQPLAVQVRFLQEKEEFVGPDLEPYGPFTANAIAKIPEKIAQIFINEGIARLENP